MISTQITVSHGVVLSILVKGGVLTRIVVAFGDSFSDGEHNLSPILKVLDFGSAEIFDLQSAVEFVLTPAFLTKANERPQPRSIRRPRGGPDQRL